MMSPSTSAGASVGTSARTSAVASAAPWPVQAAMAWDYWRRTRVRLAVAFVGISCLNVLYYQLIAKMAPPTGGLPPGAQLNLFFALFVVDVFLIVECASGRGLELRDFLLPLPTWKLAFAKMILPVATAAALWAGISLVTLAVTPRTLTGEHWPMLRPALVAAMLVAWAMAIVWLPIRPKALKWTVAAGLLAGPVKFTVSLINNSVGHPKSTWTTPTGGELAGFAAWMTLAFGVAVFAVERARRGGGLGLSTLSEFVESRALQLRRLKAGSFRSPATAQVWLEWRHKGWVVPALVACGFAVMAARGWGRTPEQVVPWFVRYATLLVFFVPTLVGGLAGRFNPSGRDPSIDLFRASRPLDNRGLSYSILATGALSLLATWATIVACLVVPLGLADIFSGESGQTGYLDLAWLAARNHLGGLGGTGAMLEALVLVVGSWTLMSLVATVFLVGRNGLTGAFVFGPIALGLVAPFLFRHLEEAAIVRVAIVGAWILSAIALTATVISFVWARSRGEIGRRTPLVALAVSFAVALVVYGLDSETVRQVVLSGAAIEWAGLVLGLGVLALAVAPLAMAPLALASNRHR